MKKSTTLSLKKSMTLVSLVAACFLAAQPAMAFDFEGALKDAVKKEIDKKTGTGDTKAPEATATDAKSTEAAKTPAAEPAKSGLESINWKSPSQAEEVALGREITGNLLGAAPLVKDAALQKYVNSVGRWVASQSERPNLPWRFGVIESNDLNAFAAPGGYVVITKGLYKKMTNEAQLAGVLGHEIGHIVAKHQLKVLQKQQLLNLGAGLLSSKLAKDNQLANKVIGSGAEISARSLDKGAEYEADRLGLSYATRAGYAPYGLVDVLQELSLTNANDGSIALLFKTHPHPDERLASLSDAVGDKLDNLSEGKTLETRFYKLKN